MDKIEKSRLLPIIFALGFIPMLVHSHTFNTGLEKFDWYPDASAQQIDFFLWYKMVAIIAVAIIMAVILVVVYVKNKRGLTWDKNWYFLLGYAALALVSALFSANKSFVFRGSYEVFESIWVVLGYVMICYYSYCMLKTERNVRFVAIGSLIGIMIVTCIGFFQFFGWDFFRTVIGKKLITDTYMWENLEGISFTFPLHTSYATLYNTNYLAFYFGLLIPIVAVLLVFTADKKKKVLYALLLVMLAVTLAGSNSKSGLLALGITFVFACIVLSKYLKKYIWIPIVVVVVFVAVIGIYANRLGGIDALKDAISSKGLQEQENEEHVVQDIDTLDDEVVFYLKDDEMHISYSLIDDSQVHIDAFDKNGEEIDSDQVDGAVVLEGDAFAGCEITPLYINDYIGLQVSIDGNDWYFTNQIDGTYDYYNAVGKFTKIPDVEKSHIFSDAMFSGRGYLWDYIIPKLKSCVIIGKGSNTFAMEYPQDNYVQKKYAGTEVLFDVKAHNFYIQQFLENGLLALLCFLAFYVYYLIQSLRLYRKQPIDSLEAMIGLGIMLGTFDYMIIAVANDSNVNTAPVFWVLLGCGLAINKMLIANDNKQVKMTVPKEEKSNGKKNTKTKKRSL